MLSMKLAAAAAVVVIVLVGVAAGAEPSPPLTGNITLVGTVREHHILVSDGSFPGRETWYYSLASSRAKGKPFGYGILACAFVSVKTSVRQCVGTYSLPRGKLSVSGSFLYPLIYELSVTGGTGVYSASSGTLSAREFTAHKGAYWLTFTLR